MEPFVQCMKELKMDEEILLHIKAHNFGS